MFGTTGREPVGDENLFAGDPLAIYLHRVVIDKLDVAFFNRELAAGQALVFFLAIAVNDFVLLLNELAEIQPDLRWRTAQDNADVAHRE
jgi:hypothetical protein